LLKAKETKPLATDFNNNPRKFGQSVAKMFLNFMKLMPGREGAKFIE